jgi:hypothetical protein
LKQEVIQLQRAVLVDLLLDFKVFLNRQEVALDVLRVKEVPLQVVKAADVNVLFVDHLDDC